MAKMFRRKKRKRRPREFQMNLKNLEITSWELVIENNKQKYVLSNLIKKGES
jgi:hypothetical protein